MSEKDKREMQIEDMIFDLLISMGIAPTLKGFRLLQYCIKESVYGRNAPTTMLMYHDLADKLYVSWESIERAMRSVIKKAIETVGTDGITERIGQAPCGKGRIEPFGFVLLCARKIRRCADDLQ